ncbi:MAG: sigma-70 family RNA polymerase sigma factor [Prevotella sp.]|nr:sigma-70 family RNA polymerase sigma factor [Prevotella sp.]
MEEIFDSFFRQYYAPMVLYTDRQLGNREQAEDVVQDVFKKLLELDFSVYNTEKLNSLVFTMLRNRIIDIHRYNQRHQQGELQDAPSEDSVEDSFFEIELHERLYSEVNALPKKISEAMQLRMQGFDNHEIAEQLGVNYHTVRSRIQRGIVMLREKFDKQFLYSIFL